MNIETQLRNKLQEISEILEVETDQNKEVGVLSGISGVALFQFYYSRFTEDDTHADKGVETITKTIELINNGFSYPTFCAGISGACWALEILKEEEFIELDDDFLSSELDSYLLEAMRADIKIAYFDFLHGAIGYGYYFLKRYQNAASEASKKIYKTYLDELITALKKTSKENEQGVWWQSVLDKEKGIVGCNLGLSHGISSTVNFLARIAVYDEFYEDVIELVQKTAYYILSYKTNDTTLTAMYPNWIVENNKTDDPSRLAWCYGDLGIGISLLKAAEVLKDTRLYNEAINTLKHSTKRRNLDEAGVKDAGICHGAYGILHMYTYLYKKTKEDVFKEASDFWMQQALDIGVHDDGYAGYKVWRGVETEKWISEVNLLEGVAGIGLTMLSYMTPLQTKWDESLLIG
ncbi:lanthionine synthetase C family protein [Aquimarina sp. I32.4]|uniref:lanthionine synthetase C family protein n=1 Tax=Aquimarina sp. I32.4 TaxID=2053903 RepID=UPI000CDF1188|nr:lanthionine synthetase C family protein [Aquimarina sp. I32.4]